MDYNTIPMEKFKFANKAERVSDKKFDTKPVSYAKDVWTRFCKNKSSVVAACIILFLLLFSIFTPIFASSNYTNSLTDTTYLQYTLLLPKNKLLAPLGVWDGCKNTTLNQNDYNYWKAIEVETGAVIMPEIYRADYTDPSSTSKTTFYDVRMDTYVSNGMYYVTLTEAQFKDIQAWQNETGVQVIYPAVNKNKIKNTSMKSDANIWYECDMKGAPVLDRAGDYKEIYLTTGAQDGYDSLRVEGDDGSYRYAKVGGTSSAKTYECRVFKYTYFQYRYGEEPSFLFGTNAKGQDILTRLAAGARFSLLLALGVSFVNLFIGAIYGAIEGYYGGTVDIIMERISDVLGSVPSMVVMSLFQLHLASKVGPVWSLIFAFMLTGWIGMAARTRMQFYRFKKQEYILSARTLGASDGRLMFKHIFPNAMGTLITGSVLSIPGVIFSESSLTYLGIVNLESSTQTSVGTLLSGGNNLLSTHPHVILFPAIFISLLMISFNLFGNGLRDAFNPSLKGVED
ncbi:MAG: ABC transporter permease [Clostridia bacterium]|nr:ABC transporter permease [Clostridia bacterium]